MLFYKENFRNETFYSIKTGKYRNIKAFIDLRAARIKSTYILSHDWVRLCTQ
jgi:hypothetical protein